MKVGADPVRQGPAARKSTVSVSLALKCWFWQVYKGSVDETCSHGVSVRLVRHSDSESAVVLGMSRLRLTGSNGWNSRKAGGCVRKVKGDVDASLS